MPIPLYDDLPLTALARLDGRVAVVTGAARGIGFACARRLSEAGATVVLADIDGVAVTMAATRLSPVASAATLDVTNEAAVMQFFARMRTDHGGVDILVNNAGIFPQTPVLAMPATEWDRVLAVNLRGVFLCAREAAGGMAGRGRGVIVNMASMDAYHPTWTGLAHYDASKGGVVAFTRALALELAPHSVRAVGVAPGNIDTEGARAMAPNLPPDEIARMTATGDARLPLGRPGTADDIARVVCFLASDLAAYITGTTVLVDGGYLLA